MFVRKNPYIALMLTLNSSNSNQISYLLQLQVFDSCRVLPEIERVEVVVTRGTVSILPALCCGNTAKYCNLRRKANFAEMR